MPWNWPSRITSITTVLLPHRHPHLHPWRKPRHRLPVASADGGSLPQAQNVASQMGCSAVRPSGGTTFTASCGSCDVQIDCDGGKCHPTHTVKPAQ